MGTSKLPGRADLPLRQAQGEAQGLLPGKGLMLSLTKHEADLPRSSQPLPLPVQSEARQAQPWHNLMLSLTKHGRLAASSPRRVTS